MRTNTNLFFKKPDIILSNLIIIQWHALQEHPVYWIAHSWSEPRSDPMWCDLMCFRCPKLMPFACTIDSQAPCLVRRGPAPLPESRNQYPDLFPEQCRKNIVTVHSVTTRAQLKEHLFISPIAPVLRLPVLDKNLFIVMNGRTVLWTEWMFHSTRLLLSFKLDLTALEMFLFNNWVNRTVNLYFLSDILSVPNRMFLLSKRIYLSNISLGKRKIDQKHTIFKIRKLHEQ